MAIVALPAVLWASNKVPPPGDKLKLIIVALPAVLLAVKAVPTSLIVALPAVLVSVNNKCEFWVGKNCALAAVLALKNLTDNAKVGRFEELLTMPAPVNNKGVSLREMLLRNE